jgi:PadR family transcriptional regulator AphA
VRTIPAKTKSLTLTEAAVLALLAVGDDQSGYELSKHAARSVGHVWSPARSHLYAVLGRLAGDGLVRVRHVVQTDRPDKQLYRITPAGRASLQEWLETVDTNDDAFQLKVFYGAFLSRERLVEHVEAYRERVRERLAVYDEIARTNTNRGHDYYHRLLLDFGYARARASLEWSEDVLMKLRRKR